MTDKTFEEKRYFGNWARDVLGDQKLVRDLDRSSNGAQAARRVAERVS